MQKNFWQDLFTHFIHYYSSRGEMKGFKSCHVAYPGDVQDPLGTYNIISGFNKLSKQFSPV